jgi:hypothetical protein
MGLASRTLGRSETKLARATEAQVISRRIVVGFKEAQEITSRLEGDEWKNQRDVFTIAHFGGILLMKNTQMPWKQSHKLHFNWQVFNVSATLGKALGSVLGPPVVVVGEVEANFTPQDLRRVAIQC